MDTATDRTLRVRLFSRLIAVPETGCLLWVGHRDRSGYGHICACEKDQLVHRVMWEMLEGPIPVSMELDHLCHTNDPHCLGGPTCPHRPCASVAHLEVVTHRVNSLRGLSAQAHNARKTHCDNDHEFTDANTYLMPRGGRDCRACIRARASRYKARKKAS